MVTSNGLVVPVQSPPQLVKVAPVSGVAVNLTKVLATYSAVQVLPPVPQLIPPLSLVTTPFSGAVKPSVTLVTVTLVVKVAVQFFAALMVKANGLVVPMQSPPQLVKVAPVSAVAVRFTTVLGA